MRSLRFEKITLTNFLSIGDTPLTFNFLDGLNLITGYNRDNPTEKNGIGKSSICDGLIFALYNETIKNLKMNDIVNDKLKKKCKVELAFNIEEGGVKHHYTIERGIKPSYCKFFMDGVEDKTLSSISKTNELISNTIGVSKDLFKQSIVMSVGKSISFFDQSKIDKRKFIEGIFNLEIFSDMLGDCRSSYNDAKRERDRLSTELANERSRVAEYIKHDKEFEDEKAKDISELKTQIHNDMDNIKELSSTLREEGSPDEMNDSLVSLNAKLEDAEKLNLKVEVKLNSIYDKMKTLKEALASASIECPTCHRPYADADAIVKVRDKHTNELKILELDKTKYANVKNTIVSTIKTLKNDRDKIRTELVGMKSIADTNKSIKSHILTIKQTCIENKKKLESTKNAKSNFAELIKTSNIEIDKLSHDYDEMYKETKVYEICKFVLSEEGVKGAIILRLKGLLNNKINNYLRLLGSSLTCVFDEYFSETIYNKNGVEKAYDSFSGGESKRIDLAILLTFQDILKDQCGLDIKLGFYDEILDTSIDDSGRVNVLEILKEKSTNTPIYIISHRSKMSDLIDNEIVLEKHDDFTFLKGVI
jgi:exonuclease SbcC